MSEKQFEEATAAIEQALTAFVAKIDNCPESGKFSPSYILESVMLALSENITNSSPSWIGRR